MSIEWLKDKLIDAAVWLQLAAQTVWNGFLSIKPGVWFKCMAVTGVLMAVTVVYSFIILPVWTYALVPAWTWLSTPSQQTAPSATPTVVSNPNPSSYNAAPIVPQNNFVSNSQPKAVNCDALIKKIKAGKYIELPEECASVYAISREQDEKNQKDQQGAQNRRDYERQQAQEQQRQQDERNRQAEIAKQQEEERRYQEQLRQAEVYNRNLREQQAQERRDREEKDRRDEARREQARQDSLQRQRNQEELQRQKNEAIIKAGRDIKSIFKKNQ